MKRHPAERWAPTSGSRRATEVVAAPSETPQRQDRPPKITDVTAVAPLPVGKGGEIEPTRQVAGPAAGPGEGVRIAGFDVTPSPDGVTVIRNQERGDRNRASSVLYRLYATDPSAPDLLVVVYALPPLEAPTPTVTMELPQTPEVPAAADDAGTTTS